MQKQQVYSIISVLLFSFLTSNAGEHHNHQMNGRKIAHGPIRLSEEDRFDCFGSLITSLTYIHKDENQVRAFLSSVCKTRLNYRSTLPENQKMKLRFKYQTASQWLKMPHDSLLKKIDSICDEAESRYQ